MGIGKTPEGDSLIGWFTIAGRRFAVALNDQWFRPAHEAVNGRHGWFIGPLTFIYGRVAV